MPFNIRNRSLLSLVHHSERDLIYLIDLARDLKRAKYSGDIRRSLAGKNIALIFEKTSTRTRCAFGLDLPAGSMGPKVAAACGFANHTGNEAVIGSLADITRIVEGSAGTRVKAA